MRRTYPSTFWKYTTYLLRCYAQINPQRIKDTPAVNLCSRLVSVSSISKGLRKGYCQRGCFKICGYLRCRLTKNSPRRTTSTPAGVFCTLLASVPPIFKSAGYAERTRMSGVLHSSEKRRWQFRYTVSHKCSTEHCRYLLAA